MKTTRMNTLMLIALCLSLAATDALAQRGGRGGGGGGGGGGGRSFGGGAPSSNAGGGGRSLGGATPTFNGGVSPSFNAGGAVRTFNGGASPSINAGGQVRSYSGRSYSNYGAGANVGVRAPGQSSVGVGAGANFSHPAINNNRLTIGNNSAVLAGSNYRPSYANHSFYQGHWNNYWGPNGAYGLGARGYGQGYGGLGYGLGYGGYGYGGLGYGGRGYGYGGYGYGGYPLGWGIGGWGLGSVLYSSGYLPYMNPYYGGGIGGGGYGGGGGGYNYSQPIQVASGGNASTTEDPNFQAALAQFKAGDYRGALASVDAAIKAQPNDAVMHEFRALVLFALQDYAQAAATIHSVLAVGPGWDWPTLASLYGDVNAYTGQLRALEDGVRGNPDKADLRFLLAYHYLTEGHRDAAATQLKQAVRLTPSDRLAGELLAMASGQSGGANPAPGSTPAPATNGSNAVNNPAPAQPMQGQSTGPQMNPNLKPIDPAALVGNWHATREDGSNFDLSLTPDKTYDWKFSQQQQGQPAQKSDMTGTYGVEKALLILQNKDGGAMIGEVTMEGNNKFNFKLLGGPPNDPGLTFTRS